VLICSNILTAIVGLDVGLNTTLPRFLMQQLKVPLAKAGLGTSLYFIARTVGYFAGVFLLAKWTSARVFRVSAALAGGCTGVVGGAGVIHGADGIGGAGGFVAFASGLMIMGVSGGAVLMLLMGLIAEYFGQAGALLFLLVTPLYLLGLAIRPSTF
jgi:MFS transporter, FHS family, L-fucose permease